MPPRHAGVAHPLRSSLMRIACWNVNSLKARLELVRDYCQSGKADILLLQEIKLLDENMPVEPFTEIGWHCLSHGQKTYNGVAILSRYPITLIRRGLPMLDDQDTDEQARWLEAEIEGLHLASLYLPNGNPRPGPKFDYKLSWMARLEAHARNLIGQEKPVILGGDFNIIPQAIDCYDPDAWAEDALFHPDSRSSFYRLCHQGWTDALRAIHPAGAHYSFWDYQAGAWQKNNGIRIDHLLLSPEAADRLQAAGVDKTPRGMERPSDHTPVWCDLALV